MASFVGEIKRRKVFQVAAAYAIVGWLLIQVASVLLPTFQAPDWVMRVFSFAVIAGFPLAVILAWAFDLTPDGIRATSESQLGEVRTRPSGQGLSYLIQGLILLAVGFLVVDQYLLEPRPSALEMSPDSTAMRFDHDFPEGQRLRGRDRRVMDFSLDGRHFVYNTDEGLFLRPMDELEAQLIPGTEPLLTSPTFSPDGQAVAYWDVATERLLRIGVNGGAALEIAEVASNPDGISWAQDDTIFFTQDDGIYRVPASGGTPERVIPIDDSDQVNDIQLLPDGDSVLFGVGPFGDWDGARVVVESLSTHERKELIPAGNAARYVPTGHLIYAYQDSLFGVAFDPESLTVSGNPELLVQGVMRPRFTGSANYNVSDDGHLVYVSGDAGTTEVTFVWVDRQGGEEALTAGPDDYYSLRLSPDGRRLAATIGVGGNSDVWIIDLETGNPPRRLTFEPDLDGRALWTPDGERIVYASRRGDSYGLYWRPADGTGQEEPLILGENPLRAETFSPDGQTLVYREEVSASEESNLYTLSMDDGVESPLLVTENDEDSAAISPDGNYIAYVSDETGTRDVFVRPFPNVLGGRWQISLTGGIEPAWGPDGDELFYLVENGPGVAVMAIDIQTTPDFQNGPPRVQFDDEYHVFGPTFPNYALSADGERFLMKREAAVFDADATPPQIVIVLNWLEELERLIPGVD